MKNHSNNPIVSLTFDFALEIIRYSKQLNKSRKYIIGKQILRSGTSIGANVMESQEAESRADFIHKLKIASKEALETDYWLKLCKYSSTYPSPDLLINKLVEVRKVLSRILSTTIKKTRAISPIE